MNEAVAASLSFIAGLGLGLFYYAGLWLTVKWVFISHKPALLLLASFVVRAAVVLLGLYAVSSGQIVRIAAYLIGFLLARIFLTNRLGPRRPGKARPAEASQTKEWSP